MRSSRLSILLLTTALSAFSMPALAQDASKAPATSESAAGQRVITYSVGYFDNYQPMNAFDMVQNVPAFSFNGGDQMRGFAGNAGNVLIDGQRPASKDHLSNILVAIPASQVERVEHIVGGAPGVDMHGHSEIVNIVRKQTGKPTLVLTGAWRSYNEYRYQPAFNINWTRKEGDKNTFLMLEMFEFTDNGANRATRHTYKPDRSDTTPDVMNIPQSAGGTGNLSKIELTRPVFGGKLTFNASTNPIDYEYDAQYITADSTGVEHMDFKEMPSETGFHFERPLTKTINMDVNLLARHYRESIDNTYAEDTDFSRYAALTVTDEEIISGKLTWQKSDKWTLRAGSELVTNSLERHSTFTENGAIRGVPNAQTRVEEERTESFVSSTWQALPSLSMETALKVETSTISVPADGRSESFVYPKPKVQLVWSPRKSLKVTVKSEKVVEQLDFDDFASSVELQSEVVVAGNSEIVPQKQWVHGVSMDYSFWEKGTLTVGYEYYDIEDTLDHLPITTPDGVFDAKGNVGDATGHIWKVALNVPLDRFRFTGGQLKLNYTHVTSSVVDPITGETREISGVEPEEFTVTLSQSLPKYRVNWGIEAGTWGYDTTYAARDIYTFRAEPWASMWVEYKTPKNLTLQLIMNNAFGGKSISGRTSYDGPRGSSSVRFEQETVSHRRPFLIFRVRKEI